MKTLSSLAAIAAMTLAMWFSVMPTGAEFCQSGQTFRAAQPNEANAKAAKLATESFCHIVEAHAA